MSEPGSRSARRHDLDALRGVAMLLVILAHAALSFMEYPWLVQDSQQHEAFAVFYYAIHGFRLPLFFMMSGFFTAMLWQKRGLNSLIQHRFRRVFLPLLLGMITVVPLMNWITGVANRVNENFVEVESTAEAGILNTLMYTPIFQHLWFLWHLCWLVAGFALIVLIGRRLPPLKLPDWLVLTPVRYLWLVPLTMIPTAFMTGFGADYSGGLLPIPRVLFYYAIFFGFGALYYGYDDPEARISKGWKLLLPVGFLVILPLALTFTSNPAVPHTLAVFLEAVYPWVLTFGLMGLFLSLFRKENKRMRYMSDSSYWLYLAHLPLVIAFQLLVREWLLPAGLKFTLVWLVPTVILLVMYETLVRYSWLGTLLNGPRQKAEKVALPQVVEEP